MWRLIVLVFFLFACSFGAGNLSIHQSTDVAARKIKRIAILPLDSDVAIDRVSPSGAATAAAGARAREKDPGAVVTELVYGAMAAAPYWQIVSDREVVETKEAQGLDAPVGRARKLGQLVYADAVLFGRVVRFRERIGEDLGVKSPASVAFNLQLVDVKRGDVIWSVQFQETQRALSENLFAISDFAHRGGKWLTAEELARDGVRKAIDQLNGLVHRAGN